MQPSHPAPAALRGTLSLATPGDARLYRAILLACLAFALVARALFLQHPWRGDAGLYAYLGQAIFHGQTLYSDIYETKFPGAAMLLAACHGLAGNSWVAHVALQALLSLAAAALLAGAIRPIAGQAAARYTLLYALLAFNLPTLLTSGYQLETFIIFFTSAAACFGVLAVHTGRALPAFLAGAAATSAMMVKPSSAGVLAALAVLALTARPQASRLPIALRLIAGAGLPPLAVLLWSASTGILHHLPEVARQVALYSAQTPFRATDLGKIALVVILLALPALVLVCRRPATAANSPPHPAIPARIFLAAAFAWLVVELLGIAAQRRMYPYYFLALGPPIACLLALAARHHRPRAVAVALLPLALVFTWGAWNIWSQRAPLPQAVAWLTQHAGNGDQLWAPDSPRLLMATGLKAASRYTLGFYLCNHDTAPAHFTAGILDDFHRRRPRWIVLPADLPATLAEWRDQHPLLQLSAVRRAGYTAAWAQLQRYVADHYRPVVTLDQHTIFERFAAPQPPIRPAALSTHADLPK